MVYLWNFLVRYINMKYAFCTCLMLMAIVALSLLQTKADNSPKFSISGPQWYIQKEPIEQDIGTYLTGFKGPYGITYHSEKIYVPDLRDGRIIEFDANLYPTRWLGFGPQGGMWYDDFTIAPNTSSVNKFSGAHAVAFTNDGRVLVADYFANQIALFSSKGRFSHFIDFGKSLPAVLGVANVTTDQNNIIWVVDFDGHKVMKFDQDLNFIGCLGDDGTGKFFGFTDSCKMVKSSALGGFFKPHMVATLDDGSFFVVETGNHRIQHFTKEGIALGYTGDDGTRRTGFRRGGDAIASSSKTGLNQPVSIVAADTFGADSFLIADNGNHRIVKMDRNGRFTNWLGGGHNGADINWSRDPIEGVKSNKAGYFAHPFHAIVVGETTLVADGHNNRIAIYKNQFR